MNTVEWARVCEPEKLGFRLAGFQLWPLDKALTTLAEIGYRSVELCLEHPDLNPEILNPEALARLKSLLGRLGLRVSSISCHGKKDSIALTLKKQLLGLNIARELGTRYLVVGTTLSQNDPQGADTLRALEVLVRAAEECDLMVAVEPEPETVIHGMYDFSMLASNLSGSSLGLNLDLGHAYLTESSPIEVIDEYASFIVHLHLEDMIRPAHNHLLPGDGYMDLQGAIMRLRENGYSGDLTVDLFDILDAPEVWAKKALERCQAIFK